MTRSSEREAWRMLGTVMVAASGLDEEDDSAGSLVIDWDGDGK